VNIEGIKAELKKLIERRKTIDEKTSEANICANFVDQLFLLLGWDIGDVKQYDRNSYVRGAGYADVALKIDSEPAIFVEVKKIGKIPKNRIDPQAQMTLPLKELADLIDRTPEEKQAFKYARSEQIPWAILTNFDCLYVFNADQERIVLSFKEPDEYLEKFDDLLRLSREKVKAKSLEWLQDQLKKEEIDKNFLEKLKNWRVSLAQNIYDENKDNQVLNNDKGDFDWDTLMHIVQRILSRLLIIQIADDREVLRTHNILETSLKSYEDKGDYSKKDYLLKEFIDLSHMMDEHHNTTIFAPEHPCEKVFISNSIFARILRELCHISFRKMTADILGATYESYLGYKFNLKNGKILAEIDQRVRKQAGIYYTPAYIVRYIVDNTLGVRLKELEDQYGLEAGEKAKDLRILDPACGSGSFLIYAFDVLAKFYERLNQKITEKQLELSKGRANPDMFERLEQLKHLPPRIANYPKRILEDHLYGVDLDPAACEIATINLVIKAFEKMRDKKLPLILNQNVKMGNSLISGVEKKEDLEKFKDEIAKHIELRRRLKQTEDDEEKRELMSQINQLREKVNSQLNEFLKKYFDDPEEKRPFNWEFEFPEVFDSEKSDEQKGFDVVIGNPPYVNIMLIQDDELEYLQHEYKSAHRRFDLYVLFGEIALILLKRNGCHSFIVPDKILSETYGRKLREIILRENNLISLLDLTSIDVFPDAANKPIVYVINKSKVTPQLQVIKVDDPLSLPRAKRWSIPSVDFLNVPEFRIRLDWSSKVKEIIEKINQNSFPASRILYVSWGAQPGVADRFFFFGQEPTCSNKSGKCKAIECPSREGLCMPLIKGGNVDRYAISYSQGHILYDPKKLHRPAFPELFENEKIVICEVTGEYGLVGSLDNRKFYSDHSLANCILKSSLQNIDEEMLKQRGIKFVKGTRADVSSTEKIYDRDVTIYDSDVKLSARYGLKFLLSLINSQLFGFYYNRYIGGGLNVFPEHIRKLPIRQIQFSDRSQKTKHDQLVKYVDIMLERNKQKNELLKIFEQVLKNHTHELQPFSKAYYDKPEYIEKIDKKATSLASSTDEVSKIFLDEKGNTLVFSVGRVATPPKAGELPDTREVEDSSLSGSLATARPTDLKGERKEVLRLKIDDENFRLFLFYSVRKYLEENKRRKKWTTKSFPKVLDVILGRLEAPLFKRAGKIHDPKHNLKMINLVVKEFRKKFLKRFPKGNLHLYQIEEEIQDTDNSIDALVFKLYGLNKKEIITVLDSMETEESIKKDILKKFGSSKS
jgi:hypothetical protein